MSGPPVGAEYLRNMKLKIFPYLTRHTFRTTNMEIIKARQEMFQCELRSVQAVRPVVRGFTCPRFQLLGLGLGLGQGLSEYLWGREFFCSLDDFG